VRHAWTGLSETAVGEVSRRSLSAVVVGLPVVAGGVTAALGAVEAGIVTGGIAVLAMSYLAPGLSRRLAKAARAVRSREVGRGDVVVLSEAAAFDRIVGIGDRISETWPELGTLVSPVEASAMLGSALWEIAGLLARREELTGVLAALNEAGASASAGFAGPAGVGPSPGWPAGIPPSGSAGVGPSSGSAGVGSSSGSAGVGSSSGSAGVGPSSGSAGVGPSSGSAGGGWSHETAALQLEAQRTATKMVLSEIEIELARREANLRRAEDAGRTFVREQRTRRAIRTAEESLRALPTDQVGAGDPRGDLAEHTQAVLIAYQELVAYQELLADRGPDQPRAPKSAT
jgi:hypothetical protein